jgi:hypothetical protein
MLRDEISLRYVILTLTLTLKFPSTLHGHAQTSMSVLHFSDIGSHGCSKCFFYYKSVVHLHVTVRTRPNSPGSRPASYNGPTGPVLRANPSPEVTDLICQLPLPTLKPNV